MATTLSIQPQHIEVYHRDEFLGYVSSVTGRGAVVICKVVKKPWKFAKRKAESVLRAATSASVCDVSGGRKYYPRTDHLTFKMVDA